MKLAPDQLAAVLQAIDDRAQELTDWVRLADMDTWRAKLETLRAARAVLVSSSRTTTAPMSIPGCDCDDCSTGLVGDEPHE